MDRLFRHLQPLSGILLALILLTGCGFQLNPTDLQAISVRLPPMASPTATVTFDDVNFDTNLGKLVAPAGGTGQLALIDPHTLAIQTITGFSTDQGVAGQARGTTSAIAVNGFLFAPDHGALKLWVIDPASGQMIGSAPLKSDPDFIRYVAATNELWVTERTAEQIEVFTLPDQPPLIPTPSAVISVPNGPEALLIDQGRGLAYTNQPKIGKTAVIQVQTHGIIAEWGNGCSAGRGFALDEEDNYLFVACNEGKLVMLDAGNNGQQITSVNYGGKLSSVSYNPALHHVYLPSSASALLAIFAVAPVPTPVTTPVTGVPPAAPTGSVPTPTDQGGPPAPNLQLVRLGTADTDFGARCVTFDDQNRIWVCDPHKGQLLMISDPFSAP